MRTSCAPSGKGYWQRSVDGGQMTRKGVEQYWTWTLVDTVQTLLYYMRVDFGVRPRVRPGVRP